jgi:hypothetical protein
MMPIQMRQARARTAAPFARRFFPGCAVALALLTGALAAVELFTPAGAQSQASVFTPRDESPEQYPAGPGRDETFYACTACHGFMLVAQQGMSRRQWDETIDLMIAKHNMPALDGNDRTVVLDYLEQTYPPTTPSGGWQNPFLNR